MPCAARRTAALAWLAAAVLMTASCTSTADTIQQQQDKLESLGATTQAIGNSWLDGEVSRTYAATALDATRAQVEEQRTTLAAVPEALRDPRGAALSQQAEQLSRLLAELQHDVAASDADAVRARLPQIPIRPQG